MTKTKPPQKPKPKFITVGEAAQEANKSVAMIRRYCQTGRIQGALKFGSTWVIPAAEWLQFRTKLAKFKPGRPGKSAKLKVRLR